MSKIEVVKKPTIEQLALLRATAAKFPPDAHKDVDALAALLAHYEALTSPYCCVCGDGLEWEALPPVCESCFGTDQYLTMTGQMVGDGVEE